MSSSESDDWGYESDNSIEVPTVPQQATTSILSLENLEEAQKQTISEMSSIFEIPEDIAISALLNNSWVIADAGMNLSICKTPSLTDSMTTCIICFEDLPAWDMRSSQCGHFFCRSCYKSHLLSQIANGPPCIFTYCPQDSCKVLVPKSLLKELLDLSSFSKYEKYLVNSYVELNSSLKWCPGPNCTFAVSSSAKNVTCKCMFTWCYECNKDLHRPLTCQRLTDWENEQNNSDFQWINVNTKQCPSCKWPIEKNDGCMHMTCRCKHEFCWLCLGPWAGHGSDFYSCNKFSEDSKNGLYNDLHKSKQNTQLKLRRLNVYSERMAEHLKSLRCAQQKQKRLREIAQSVREIYDYDWNFDPEFLARAGNLIVEARSAVAYSYAFAYFLNSLSKIKILEYKQAMLERTLENLDENTDNVETHLYGGKQSFGQYRLIVQDLTDLLRSHLDSSLEEMENDFPFTEESKEVVDEEETVLLDQHSQNWTCEKCTLINPIVVELCVACNFQRPRR